MATEAQTKTTDEDAFATKLLDACDSILDAKDIAKRLGWQFDAELSELMQRIHAFMDQNIPGFGS